MPRSFDVNCHLCVMPEVALVCSPLAQPCAVPSCLKDTPLHLHSCLEKAWAVPVLELQFVFKGI